MSEKNKESYTGNGFYMKIDEELKRQFNIKCLENGTNMSEVVKNYMKKYIAN